MVTLVQPGVCAWCSQIILLPYKPCSAMSDAERRAHAVDLTTRVDTDQVKRCKAQLKAKNFF